MYKATTFLESEQESMKVCCINIHLTINPFTLIEVLHLLIIVHDSYTLSEKNEVFFITNFTDLLMFS